MMENKTKPFNTGIRPFDHHYASQARGGDSWLLFSCPGAGTTTLACQTAGISANNGKRVLYITTKETGADILMRAYSAASGIPYAAVLDLKGSPDHMLAPGFREWAKTEGSNLHIVEYRDGNGIGFEDYYTQIITKHHKEHGAVPDLTVLDQISGVFQRPFEDHIQKCVAFNKVAATVARISRNLNNVAIIIAQANRRIADRISFTENDTADSRTLCESMTGVLGITSLLNHDSGEGPLKRHDQYLVILKCRDGETKRIKVNTRFDLARFEGIADGQNSKLGTEHPTVPRT